MGWKWPKKLTFSFLRLKTRTKVKNYSFFRKKFSYLCKQLVRRQTSQDTVLRAAAALRGEADKKKTLYFPNYSTNMMYDKNYEAPAMNSWSVETELGFAMSDFNENTDFQGFGEDNSWSW